MHGKILQVPKLLVGLVLIFIAGLSRARYNLDGRDNEIATTKVTVAKGILCMFFTINKRIP